MTNRCPSFRYLSYSSIADRIHFRIKDGFYCLKCSYNASVMVTLNLHMLIEFFGQNLKRNNPGPTSPLCSRVRVKKLPR